MPKSSKGGRGEGTSKKSAVKPSNGMRGEKIKGAIGPARIEGRTEHGEPGIKPKWSIWPNGGE